jgi:peptide deformylase
MAHLEIKIYPNSILTQKAGPVEEIDHSIRQLLDDMAETMYTDRGIGLAAPQVGVSLRAVVIDASPRVEGETLLKLINPVVTLAEGQAEHEEGCLSIPEFSASVTRAAHVVVQATDENGAPVTLDTDTFLATVLQHEIDHLDGILFIDHLGRLKRDLIRQKLRKRSRRNRKTRASAKDRL